MRSPVGLARSATLTRTLGVLAAVVAAGGLAILYRFDPETVHFFPRCVFHQLTGLQCPGCGTTRALHHLLHGDVAGAFHYNAMLFVVAPFGAIASTSRRFATHPITGWSAVIVTVVWWVGRNVM
ncbi:MAG: hypothetical protein QOK37_961 [Thermoanaerobaculia bacterium]|jgi:hypothetical protein|nr:hypothetical protein [Thermoanaerobaculia bacterium]